MRQRRKYSDEFKREAVTFANQPNISLRQVAEELGLNASMLGRWRRELTEHGKKAFIGKGSARDEEITALRRELTRVKRERDFLKEAAAFFAKESR